MKRILVTTALAATMLATVLAAGTATANTPDTCTREIVTDTYGDILEKETRERTGNTTEWSPWADWPGAGPVNDDGRSRAGHHGGTHNHPTKFDRDYRYVVVGQFTSGSTTTIEEYPCPPTDTTPTSTQPTATTTSPSTTTAPPSSPAPTSTAPEATTTSSTPTTSTPATSSVPQSSLPDTTTSSTTSLPVLSSSTTIAPTTTASAPTTSSPTSSAPTTLIPPASSTPTTLFLPPPPEPTTTAAAPPPDRCILDDGTILHEYEIVEGPDWHGTTERTVVPCGPVTPDTPAPVVTPAPAPTGELPATGNNLTIALLAALAVLIGTSAVWAARRKPTT